MVTDNIAPHSPRCMSAGMVRITVKLRPEQYDALFRHVREVGSTMSAFCRESAVKAMTDEHPEPQSSPGRPRS